jgi:hypothetical protein
LFCPFQQIGDKIYRKDEAGEILEDSIEDINVTELKGYGYYQSDYGDTDDEEADESEEYDCITEEPNASTDVDGKKLVVHSGQTTATGNLNQWKEKCWAQMTIKVAVQMTDAA